MNREEFDKLYVGKAIHCDTEEKAREFLALADSVGYWWNSGTSLIEKNKWETYGEDTCYEITDDGLMYANTNYFNSSRCQIIEYQLQLKFKVGDKVRVNNTAFTTLNGEVGIIVETDSISPMSYAVKVGPEGWTMWFFECQLEKVEEPKFKVGDTVRIKDTQSFYIDGKIGVIEKVNVLAGLPYFVNIYGDGWLWVMAEENLEKFEEPTYKEETIDDIKTKLNQINILLNKLKRD